MVLIGCKTVDPNTTPVRKLHINLHDYLFDYLSFWRKLSRVEKAKVVSLIPTSEFRELKKESYDLRRKKNCYNRNRRLYEKYKVSK